MKPGQRIEAGTHWLEASSLTNDPWSPLKSEQLEDTLKENIADSFGQTVKELKVTPYSGTISI